MSSKRMRTTKNMNHAKHAKKLLCCVLTGCLLAGMMPSAALAETGEPNAPEVPTTAETPATAEASKAPAAPTAPTAPETPTVSETPKAPTAPEIPTTPATPAAIEVPEAPTADGAPAGQSDADGDEYGISLLGIDADGSVSYLDYNEKTGEMDTKTITKDTPYTVVTNSAVAVTWEAGWYVVEDPDVKIDGTVTFTGDVRLILCDDAELTVTGGITDDDYLSRTLTIYGQSDATDDTAHTGRLIVQNTDDNGICASRGLVVNGGVVDATGGIWSPWGGGYSYGIDASVTVHGGSVTGRGGDGKEESYGIYAHKLIVTGGRLCGTSNENAALNAGIYVISGFYDITGGEFVGDTEFTNISGGYYISGGSFTQKLIVSASGKSVTDLLYENCVFRTIGAAAPLRWSEVENKIYLEHVSVALCTHDVPDSDGKCPCCHAALRASLTSGAATTYYTYCEYAIDAAGAGDTVTLLADDTYSVYCTSKSCILDLNGKILDRLRVTITPIIVTDSAGGGKVVWLSTAGGVEISELLQEGYIFKGDDSEWYDGTHNAGATSIKNVTVRHPLLSLTPASSGLTTGYKAEATAVINAKVQGTDGVEPVNYQWYVKNRSDSDFGEPETATGAAFHFPEGKAVGAYEVKCEADCDGYLLSQTVTVTVSQPSSSGGGSSAPIIAPSEKPSDQPENKPAPDRIELLHAIWRMPFRLISILHLPTLSFSRLTWERMLDLILCYIDPQ